jgi:hypothetical protein
MNAGALPAMGKTLVQQKSKVQALKLREDANFARDVGIPTLAIDPSLRPAARQIINMLRGAYIKEPKATAALTRLRDLAGSGNKDARMLWALAANISETAWELHRGGGKKLGGMMAAGDGLGEGYNQAAFQPPHNPARVLSAGEAGNGGILDMTLANGAGGPYWGVLCSLFSSFSAVFTSFRRKTWKGVARRRRRVPIRASGPLSSWLAKLV